MTPTERLQRVTNIVVLMMENRSFDHMLGYLPHVNGLKGGESNTGSDGTVHRSQPMDAFAGVLPDILAIAQGPEHNRSDALEQFGSRNPDGTWAMDGFVRNYEHVRHATPGVVMGHYTAQHVPMYDFLAREFAVCDRWFSSAPSWTWPNRLFTLCGEAGGVSGEGTVPLFFKRSFFRQLDASAVEWRCYSHDFVTLSLTDARYRFRHQFPRQFRSFEEQFERDCTAGLTAVTWLDPNLYVSSRSGANDDHPPVSIAKGQQLIRRVYEALSRTPNWATTLFLVVYDEHGGFYDHVSPERSGDDAPFDWYGPRVPALVVSPLVERGSVCSQTFDHTSIIRTILERFCPLRVRELPPRVQRAAHLGHALSESAPRAAIPVTFQRAGLSNVPGLELTDLQRARITADYLLELERKRSGDAPDAPMPELSGLERGVIAANYLSARVGTAGNDGNA